MSLKFCSSLSFLPKRFFSAKIYNRSYLPLARSCMLIADKYNDIRRENFQRYIHVESQSDGDLKRDSDGTGHGWQKEPRTTYGRAIAAITIIGAGAGLIIYKRYCNGVQGMLFGASASCAESEADIMSTAGQRRPELPDYTYDEIADHATAETRIWVTFRGGVYDITEFVVRHPGGEKIMMAVGGSLEPFWEMYGVHKTTHVLEILETLRIGNVDPEDLKRQQMEMAASGGKSVAEDFYALEPKRHPALKIDVAKPFNAETPMSLLTDHFVTPNELFFVRNHLPVPPLTSARTAKVEITGVGMKTPITFTIDELRRKFKVHTISSTIQCAGNRRSEMHKSKAVRGIQWGVAAVSNAEWTGVKLADVLAATGVKEENVKHVLFQGMDKDLEGSTYEASIPAETAFDPRRDVLLAFEMNGKEIPRDHGYPLRVIVPGTVGARQVKWLQRIILDKEESKSFWQQKDYKTFNPSTDWDSTDLSQAIPIQDYPVQSAICEPIDGSNVQVMDGGCLTLKGYAMSGGGRGIVRVDITVDEGLTWHEATLHTAAQPINRNWAWTLWEVSIPLSVLGANNGKKGVEVACKATDTSQNTQPETDVGIWNMRGLLENKWHRIRIDINVPPKNN